LLDCSRQQFRNRPRSRSAIVFVLARGMNAERLAHILLMDARPLSSIAYPVITLNHDGDLIAEVLHVEFGTISPAALANCSEKCSFSA
jgi:hypothetical protein